MINCISSPGKVLVHVLSSPLYVVPVGLDPLLHAPRGRGRVQLAADERGVVEVAPVGAALLVLAVLLLEPGRKERVEN